MQNSNTSTDSENIEDTKIVCADIGAFGGLKYPWVGHESEIVAVMFEPDKNAAQEVINNTAQFHKTIVINSALGATKEVRKLNMTKSIGCTSLLKPNIDLMEMYSISPALEIVEEAFIETQTYSSLHQIGKVPRPDFLKVDVQGFEYEVLLGFG